MPITTSDPVQWVDQQTFYEIDYRVRGIAFEIHNELGRFCDEKIYQRELIRRGTRAGLEMVSELRMTASLADFRKDYFADCLINRGVILETKTATNLTPSHRGQTLNYLFLCGLNHGTLLNFRNEQLVHEFVSTKLAPQARQCYRLSLENFRPLSTDCERIVELLPRLLNEWGTHLDPLLYRDALIHFLAGVREPVGIYCDDNLVGYQELPIFSKDIALSITAAVDQLPLVADHQRRLLKHTRLRGIQWINFHHENIELRTIERS